MVNKKLQELLKQHPDDLEVVLIEPCSGLEIREYSFDDVFVNIPESLAIVIKYTKILKLK